LDFDLARATIPTRGRKMTLANFRRDEFEALRALAKQPATQKITEGDRLALVAARQAIVDRIAAKDKAEEGAWPARQRDVDRAAANVRGAEAALRAANEQLRAANAASANGNATFERDLREDQADLVSTADVATIEAWKLECREELDRLRRPGVVIWGETLQVDPFDPRKSTRARWGNGASVRARLEAVAQTHREAELLKFVPDQARLPELIRQARSLWREIDQNPGPDPVPGGHK
jgi:hypothetical protein